MEEIKAETWITSLSEESVRFDTMKDSLSVLNRQLSFHHDGQVKCSVPQKYMNERGTFPLTNQRLCSWASGPESREHSS